MTSAIEQLPSVTRKVLVRVGASSGAGNRGRGVRAVLREHYLRDDVDCGAKICFEAHDGPRAHSLLPADVTHYLIPLEDVATKYLDVLEHRELSGIIFLQSVVNIVQQASSGGGLRRYRRVCALIKDAAKGSVFFPNEFFSRTHVERRADEEPFMWRARSAHAAATWYYEHLAGQKPIVLVTENEEVVRQFGNDRLEVFVVLLRTYLKDFWPTLTDLGLLYESIRDAHTRSDASAEDYSEHLGLETLESGIRRGKYIRGRLSVDKHHSRNEAFVISTGKDDDEGILIAGMQSRNRAIHGDLVAVELLPKSEWKSKITRLAQQKAPAKKLKLDGDDDVADDEEEEEPEEEVWTKTASVSPTGRVVGILERNWREYVATIPKEEAGSLSKRAGKRILVSPFDRRIPKIRILTTQAHTLGGHRIVVRIDNWKACSRFPDGHLVKSLGECDNLEAEISGILTENEIAVNPFSQGILSEMPPADWSPDEEEVARRKDLRTSHFVMSIDPKGCEDVDDAISVKKLQNGNLELGVHIADVTYFVKEHSLADKEAEKRATTVYLADRRFDMLPQVLSGNICSLLGGVDRYAVSVIWELDPKSCRAINVWYGRTVIRSQYKLYYEAAQAILDHKSAEEMKACIPELEGFSGQGLQKKFGQLAESLRLLTHIAETVMESRNRKGALSLESSSEVRFEFNETSLEDIRPKEHLPIHETVAECMILANHWVAKKIAQAFPDRALLRRHPPPRKESFEELKRCAASRGWHIDVWSNQVLAESLKRCVDPSDSSVNFLLRSLATYAMVQAVYFSTGSVASPGLWEHYGLALEQYTHFTSPIRRYADVIVHRLLLAALKAQDWWSDGAADGVDAVATDGTMGSGRLQEVCFHINERNRAAQAAQRASQLLFQTLYFKGKEPDDPRCIVEAVIFSIRSNGFLVYVPRYALKGSVFMKNLDGQVLVCNPSVGPMWCAGDLAQEGHCLHVVPVAESGRKVKQTYRLFEHVTVTIQLVRSSEAHQNTLAYYLLGKKASKVEARSTQVALKLADGEVNFLKELQRERDEALPSASDSAAELSSDSDIPSAGASTGSIYDFFQNMKLLGMKDDQDI